MQRLSTEQLQALRASEVPQGPYNITPLLVQKTYGAILEDTDGRQYLDFTGGIGVENVGHAAPEVVEAIKDQVDAYIHPCFHVAAYEPYILLARELNRLTPGSFAKKTIFLNSGAEAVENAIKIARYATRRPAVVAFENAYHGRTYMAMTLTSQSMPYKDGFGPFCPEVYRAPFAYCYRCPFELEPSSCGLRCAEHMENFFTTHVKAESVAAMIVEPIQGEGGFIVPPEGYLARLHQICQKHGILLIADEIQSGMGRTGKLYACEHTGLEPDMILSGKALGGGLPLTAVTGRAEIMDATHAGGLGGTFAGNPVSCRAGVAVVELLTGGLLDQAQGLARELEAQFRGLETKHRLVGQVRGRGLMWGMELVRDQDSKEPADSEAAQVVSQCLERGLIVLRCGVHHNVIRTLMPLTVTSQELEQGFAILDQVLTDLER